jgi:hypothetical protein
LTESTMRLLELFAGTGSVGEVFRERGWEVVSLDRDMDADLRMDIVDWNFRRDFQPGHFDMIWASPPCTQYSVAKTRGVRDIAQANAVVLRTLEIIHYLNPIAYFLENPQTGQLKQQPFMQGYRYTDVDYCRYGTAYKKRTRLWHNCPFFHGRLCHKLCGQMNAAMAKHRERAQNGLHDVNGVATSSRRFSQMQLYHIPGALAEDVADAVERMLS